MHKMMPLKVAALLTVLMTPALALAGQKIEFDGLPAAVKATALREIKTGRILEVEQDTEHGQLVYEIDFVDAGVEWELDIAADGTLLRRSLD